MSFLLAPVLSSILFWYQIVRVYCLLNKALSETPTLASERLSMRCTTFARDQNPHCSNYSRVMENWTVQTSIEIILLHLHSLILFRMDNGEDIEGIGGGGCLIYIPLTGCGHFPAFTPGCTVHKNSPGLTIYIESTDLGWAYDYAIPGKGSVKPC